jgi:hypothetical protein
MSLARLTAATGLLALFATLAACSEHPQTATHRKADGHAFDGPGTAYTAGNWKAGDEAGWEAQIRIRSQGQNEYSRTGAPP